METLPVELWSNIIHFLPLIDIMKLAKVNKFLFMATKENKIWSYNNNEGIKIANYNKCLSFIGHCRTIKYFNDLSLGYKYYLGHYLSLSKNNLTTINIRLSSLFELDFIRSNKNVKNLKISSSLELYPSYILNLLDDLKYLKSFHIINSGNDDRIIEKINKYKLNNLVFEACSNLYKIGDIEQTKLKKLKFISQPDIKNEEIIKLISKQTQLEELTLSLMEVNTFTVMAISDVGRKLTKLDLSFSQGILDDLSAYMISESCPKLETLNLSASDITNIGVFFITKSCPYITNFSIAGTYITDMALINIALRYPNIVRLETEFNNISRIGIFNLLLRCKKLSHLNILNDRLSINYISHVYSQVSINKIMRNI
jgi:hypothetical protein